MKRIRQFAVRMAFTSAALANVSPAFTETVANATMHNRKPMNRCADPTKIQL